MPRTAAQQTPPPPLRYSKTGWSPERRARQATRIRLWAPWAKSTGPKTAAGKARSAKNARKHGLRGREWLKIRGIMVLQRRIHQNAIDYARFQKRSNKLLDETVIHAYNRTAKLIAGMLHSEIMKKFNLPDHPS